MDKNLVVFKVITTFVNELSSVFGQKQKSLLLYNRLLQKTGLSLEKAIQKHISIFKDFCVSNREAINTKNSDKIVKDKIAYNENIYINIKGIFSKADSSASKVIWKHILTIAAFLDQEGDAKTVLMKEKLSESKTDSGSEESDPSGEKEQDFIKKMMSKVETSVKQEDIDKEKPMESIMKLVSSGTFNDIIVDMQKGIKSGEIDIGKLLGTVNGMMGDVQSQAGGEGMPMPDLTSMMSMMSMFNPQSIAKN